MLANQTNQLTAIYNYTHKIPDLRLLLEQLINQSAGGNQQENAEQETNTTQNCTKQQSTQNLLIVMTDIPVKTRSVPYKRYNANFGLTTVKQTCCLLVKYKFFFVIYMLTFIFI